MQNITIGRIVRYRVGPDNKDLMVNGIQVGDQLPAMIVRVWEGEYGDQPGLNLRVFTDGPADGWVTSVREGDEVGQWSWPQIQK